MSENDLSNAKIECCREQQDRSFAQQIRDKLAQYYQSLSAQGGGKYRRIDFVGAGSSQRVVTANSNRLYLGFFNLSSFITLAQTNSSDPNEYFPGQLAANGILEFRLEDGLVCTGEWYCMPAGPSSLHIIESLAG
ncbi:MAG: hypothetical protein QXW38_09540 [Candidatus Nitrosotenuis sp.]